MALDFKTAASQFVEAFKGEEGTYGFHDPGKKVYVLVAAGELAEHYKNVVEAVKGLAQVEAERMAKVIAEALKQEKGK